MLGQLPRQWMLQPSDAPSPTGAINVHCEAGWALHAHPALVAAIGGGPAGTVVICGVAVDAMNPSASMCTIASRLAQMDAPAFDRVLDDIVGCYVVFAWAGGVCRIYTDPGASLGVYYDPSGDTAASTPLLLGEYPRDAQTKHWFGARPQNNWVPSPSTIFEGIRVVPANHVVEAGSWRMSRFWPVEPEANATKDPVSAISEELQAAFKGVANDGRSLHLSLTGGYDSRANLAAARQIVGRVRFFTLRARGVSGADIVLARRLADVVGIQLRVIDCPDPTIQQLDAYDRQCGYQAFGARRNIIAGCAQVAGGPAIHIHGGLGVLLKNFYGARSGSRSQAVRIPELLTDFDRPPQSIVAGTERWLQSVQAFPPQLQRTLMYLEQRAPRWAGPADLASTLFYDPFTPFASRRIAMTAAFAPDQMLEAGRLHRAVIERCWPELLEVPFTKPRSALRRALPRGVKERLRPMKKLFDSRRRLN